jgi:hypothetical protein
VQDEPVGESTGEPISVLLVILQVSQIAGKGTEKQTKPAV